MPFAPVWIVRFDVTTRAARRWPELPLQGLQDEGIRAGRGYLRGRRWAYVEAPSGAQAMAWIARFLPHGVTAVDVRPSVRAA